jgi:anti-sigma B factor antagonist
MSMKAKVRTDSCGNIIIHMEGGLDYENTAPLKNELETLTKENPSSQITIDLNRLDFVG